MKSKVMLGLSFYGLIFTLAGVMMASVGDAQQTMERSTKSTVHALAGDDDWDYWSDPGVLCPVTLTDYVGIGTASPSCLLHVEGKAISGESSNASGDYATISGGRGNVANDQYATIGGGQYNDAIADRTTIGGGENNTASGHHATVGGGYYNVASGHYTTVGGGNHNSATCPTATVPGGSDNTACGYYTLAAGRRAMADHDGSFVWGDSTNADFASTGNNQFLIRANGGVGINTSSPENALHVNGAVNLNPVSEPAQPSAGFVIYVDASDGGLKAKSSAGTVTVLANP